MAAAEGHDGRMIRAPALIFLALLLLAPAGQAPSVLRIKVVLIDAARQPTPVPRHALLISDNPPSATPRRVVTGLDGTAELKLLPGSYIVESDRPVSFEGRTFEWTQVVEVAAGRDATLELTADNAEAGSAPAAPDTAGGSAAADADPVFLLTRWQNSVLSLWTPTTHASGFLIDAKGLIATNQRVVGSASSIEVQLTRETKVAATVLVADAERDIAILSMDPKSLEAAKPVPVACTDGSARVERGQEIFTIGASLRHRKNMTSATVSRVDAKVLVSDLLLERGSAGGPVFAANGDLVGVTSVADDSDLGIHGEFRVVRGNNLCDVLTSAEKKIAAAKPPSAAPLPVEPVRPYPVSALKAAVEKRAGSLSPYQVTSSTFDVSMITPVLLYGAQYQAEQLSRSRNKSGGTPALEPPLMRPLLDFRNWSEYVLDFPPVLLVRVTPKMAEGFWTMVARGAARTQGVSIPPIKRIKSGFSRLRAFCGTTEVTPIHPFKIEQRGDDDNTVYEGLYVFDPGALRPECGTVKLEMFGEKQPDKGESVVVDARVIEQIWKDFEGYR